MRAVYEAPKHRKFKPINSAARGPDVARWHWARFTLHDLAFLFLWRALNSPGSIAALTPLCHMPSRLRCALASITSQPLRGRCA